jgi:hypothetical protein
MDGLFVYDPDAETPLSMSTVNDYQRSALGQVKQPVAATVRPVNCCVVTEERENSYAIVGAQTWIRHHPACGRCGETIEADPNSAIRRPDSKQFRYQVIWGSHSGPTGAEGAIGEFETVRGARVDPGHTPVTRELGTARRLMCSGFRQS